MPNDIADWTGTGAAPQRSVGSFTAPSGQNTSATVTVSPATHSLAILFNSIANVTSFNVTGGTSGAQYAQITVASPVTLGPLFFIPILSVVDTTVTIQVVMGGAGQSATVRLGEIDDPEAVVVLQQQALVTGQTPQTTTSLVDVVDRLVRQVGSVIKVDSTNHEYEPASASVFTSGFSVGAGATVVLLSGVAQQTVTVLGIITDDNASNTVCQFEDTAQTVVFCHLLQLNTLATRPRPIFGLQGAVGAGIQIRNLNATASGNIWSTIHYRRP